MRLSVVIPTRNRPEMLARALRSVMEGGGAEGEYEVVVSDNSEGGESEALVGREFGGRPVRYARNEPPTGMVENWNAGLGRAVGEWVVFVHDDDFLLPGWWSRMEGVWSGRGGVMGHAFSVQAVDEEERPLRRGGRHREGWLNEREATRALLTHSSLIRFPGMVLRREWMVEAGGFDPAWGDLADLEMWLKVAGAGGIAFHAGVLSAYTIHQGAATGRMFGEHTLRGVYELGERCLREGRIGEGELRRARARFFWRFILAGAWRARRQGNREEARRILDLRRLPMFGGLACPWRWRLVDWMLSAW